MKLGRVARWTGVAAVTGLLVLATGGSETRGAQQVAGAAQTDGAGLPAVSPTGAIVKLSGAWVGGQGFAVIFGGSYEACAARCLDTPSCMMLEFYRPERRCNLYDSLKPRMTGGASIVGIRQ